jgi:hypothetical protein
MESHDDDPASNKSPKLYLVIANICKISNVRQLLLTATAMDLEGVLVVGQGRNLQDGDLPSGFTQQVDAGRIQLLRFPKWNDCVQYLKAQSISLVGIEIDESVRLIFETVALTIDHNAESRLASSIYTQASIYLM